MTTKMSLANESLLANIFSKSDDTNEQTHKWNVDFYIQFFAKIKKALPKLIQLIHHHQVK